LNWIGRENMLLLAAIPAQDQNQCPFISNPALTMCTGDISMRGLRRG
jgi:hypothetical protein